MREVPYEFKTEEPNWEEIDVLTGQFLCYDPPQNIDDIIEDVPLKRRKPELAKVQVANFPFGRGVERVAFFGKDLSSRAGLFSSIYTAPAYDIVLKEYRHEYPGQLSHRFETSNQVQTIASFLANSYCRAVRRKIGRRMTIEFLKTKTLVIQDENGRLF